MEPDKIWAEIERRRERARDLKLREELWLLYSSVLRGYAYALANDAELIYLPIRESLSIARGVYQFTLGDISYKLIYREGKKERNSRKARLTGIKTITTPITLTLHVDSKLAFEFSMKNSVTAAPEGPLFREDLGEITAFVEGPWMQAIVELVENASQHQLAVWKKRNPSKSERELRKNMKRFGL